jgi:hypothetical protein
MAGEPLGAEKAGEAAACLFRGEWEEEEEEEARELSMLPFSEPSKDASTASVTCEISREVVVLMPASTAALGECAWG